MKPALLKLGKLTAQHLSHVPITSGDRDNARIYYCTDNDQIGCGVSIPTGRAVDGAATDNAPVADTYPYPTAGNDCNCSCDNTPALWPPTRRRRRRRI
jgi:hypothetical protein